MMTPPAPARAPATAAAFLGSSTFIPLLQEVPRFSFIPLLRRAGSSNSRDARDSRTFLTATHAADDPAGRGTSPVRPLPSTATTVPGAAGVLLGTPRGDGRLRNGGISSSGAATAVNGRLPSTVERQVQLDTEETQRRRRYAQAIRGDLSAAQLQSTPNDGGGSAGASLGNSLNKNAEVIRSAPVVTAAAAAAPPSTTTFPRRRQPAVPARPPTNAAKLPRYLEQLIDRGDWRKAVSAFEKARKHQASVFRKAPVHPTDPTSVLTRGAYNQALLAYAKGRDGRGALELLRCMREEGGGIAPTRGSFNACLNACRYGGQRDKVMAVLEMMVEDGVPPSGKSYSSALQACAKEGNVPDARKMLGWMWTSPDLEGGIKGPRPTTWGYNCAMEACARSGDWASAFELMGEMTRHGLAHDAFTYGAALEACGRTGNWQKAEDVVKQMAGAYADSLEPFDYGGKSDRVVAGDASTATLAPTAVHCNALLQAYSRGKRMDKALRLLDQMLAVTIPGAVASVPALGSPTAAAGQPATTLSAGASDANGVMKINTGVGGDESGGPLPLWDPRLPLSRPDAVSFGTVIDGCSRARMADEAVGLLTIMRRERISGTCISRAEKTAALGGGEDGGGGGSDGDSEGLLLPPNVHCVTAAITACGRVNRPDQAVAVLEEAVAMENAWLKQLARQRRQRPPQDQDQDQNQVEESAFSGPVVAAAPPALTTLATAAEGPKALDRRHQQRPGEQGGVAGGEAIPAFGEEASATATFLEGAGAAARGSTAAAAVAEGAVAVAFSGKMGLENAAVSDNRPVESATAVAAAALESSPPEGAAAAMADSLFSGALRPAYNAAINACLGTGRNGQARALMRNMRERGLRPGREIFNSLLVACSDAFEAFDILGEMEVARVDPDVASYTAAMGACSRGGNLKAALELFGMMRGTSPAAGAGGTGAGTSDSRAATGGGLGGRGERIRQRAPRADAQAYGAAAAACARGLDHKAAVRLLGDMREAGLRPGRPMFGAVIDACARRGKWEQAVALLEEMTASGVAPALRHYSSAIFACSMGENPGKGLELLSKMRKKRVRTNSTCVNAAIHGFTLLGDWETALDILESMERVYQVVPDAVTYNTAMKACFRVGRNQEGLALFDRMRDYPPDSPRGGKGTPFFFSSSSASSPRGRPRHPFLKVSLRNGAEVLPARRGNLEEVASATAASSATMAATATPAAGRGKSKDVGKKKGTGRGAGVGGFRTSSPPRPDTASYNTVITAVASSWGLEGRQQAMALVDEMRARGLQPDTFTALAAEKAGWEVEL
eukprot:g12253.t1